MRRIKKILAFIIVFSIVIIELTASISKAMIIPEGRPIKVVGIVYTFDDIFISLIKKSLEDIQKENEGKFELTFFDSKSNPTIQSENIDKSIEEDFDLILLNMVENKKEVIEDVFTKFRKKNVPIILIGPNIPITNAFNTYSKAFFIGSDPIESGIIQGKLIADTWNVNKEVMDKNKDDTMQYILIKGKSSSKYTTIRSKYSIDTINDLGIKTQELISIGADWNRELARNSILSLFLKYGNKIEAIISNNDTMAIGAIEALQQYGYNKGNNLKTIPIFGFDGIEEGKEFVKKGYMIGTVFQDPAIIAKAIYIVGNNLLSDKIPTYGTNYKINGKEIIVPLAYQPYTTATN
ncbi:galactose ABC transporter substrate-binding protein [Clostridium sp. SHJSY1]|uniref:galactose ABC transporter substrate-binding protein n=1 Tax=Clostridium sp. SHJSY1 TaxID=2942483 RepID=UPI002876504E|nr:galactose ABC transporter substrate-binding protein [Clostridium sp. SHJSY1]MDS0525958.1 galactose ABC transporter substrate-binding protein [Clostridium sp. SHJSY1]